MKEILTCRDKDADIEKQKKRRRGEMIPPTTSAKHQPVYRKSPSLRNTKPSARPTKDPLSQVLPSHESN